MGTQNGKRANAFKHGAFAGITIIPGEDPQEFAELHSDLIQEWEPSGATEEDAVLTIAKGMWRKRRVQKFIEAKLAQNVLDPSHPSYDKSLGLLGFMAALKVKPESAFAEYASRFLRKDQIKYLGEKFPIVKFKSAAERAQAVMNEINSVLLPEVAVAGPMATSAYFIQSAATLSGDSFKEELALDERLDAMIDRAIKRLVQIKAMKPMLGLTLTDRANDQQSRVRLTELAK